jgi:hypothetical protein
VLNRSVCLYVEVEISVKAVGAAIANRDPKSAPKEPLPYSFQF